MRLRFLVAFLVLLGTAGAVPVIHRFEVWGKLPADGHLYLYTGWTNGFLLGRGQAAMPLMKCLEGMTTDQATAMIDKHYKDHPEHWSHGLAQEMLEALTVEGGPCEGKNPAK
jgi:hypothetical protein